MSDAPPKSERATLPREFSAFLVELSIALHKHAMYPSEHPSLEPAAAAVADHARRMLEDREIISFGVARRQLIIEGVATDPEQPVLRRLAEGLHQHHLGAISVLRGIETGEIRDALRALAADAERAGPLGLQPPELLPAWPHLRLHPLTFDRLTLTAEAPLVPGSSGKVDTRGAELWIGLARAALASDAARPLEPSAMEPSIVAQAIDEHPNAEGYDQVIVGYLLQIARELKDAPDAEAAALRRRTARLVAALKPETLRRLVEMGGDAAQRHAFVLDATHGMAVDAVLEILKAAAGAGGQTISHGLVRMLSKLAAQAELGREQARPLADVALREQVGRLLTDWQLADPNPEAYGRLLQHLAATAPVERPRGAAGEHSDRPDPVRMAQMSLEIGGTGPLLQRAVERSVDEGAVSALLQMVSSRPEEANAAADAILTRLREPDSIRKMLAREPIDFASLDQLLPSMPLDSFGVLLDSLAASDDRATRRKLMDRLSHCELDIGSLVKAHLEDERWFVPRNMLALLEQTGRVPAGFSASRWTTHPDARVRQQGVRLQLTMPAERDQALRTSLTDDDPRIVRMGLSELQRECPPSMVNLVVRIAENPAVEDDLRVLAIRALGRSREPVAVQTIVSVVNVGKTLLGRPRLPQRTPLLLAALRALADGWSADPAAASILTLATESSDAEVRQSVERATS